MRNTLLSSSSSACFSCPARRAAGDVLLGWPSLTWAGLGDPQQHPGSAAHPAGFVVLLCICKLSDVCVQIAMRASPCLEFAVIETAELGKHCLKPGQFLVRWEDPSVV